ncbi:hypothetical protein [Bradyrhizobium sp. SZCCHNRI2049]|uniref:hypothetical protein n=2 Tax=unclassified Bradyrhizobium TaxID=2631580 RepID=UPI002915C4BB|nr:hypothetical protein [Bradyrhizobium sp. SZCCHNRI2049]
MRTAALLAIGSGALFPLLASGLSWFKTPDTSSQPTSVAELSFVGSQACSGCHQAETGLWQSSQHRHAMDHANDTSVRGDFNDTAFEYAGTRSRFFRKDRKFLVEKAHKADPNANREWEWQFARENAPLEIKICLFLARYKARKNDKFVNLPVLPELQAFMGELKVQRADGLIAVRDDGTVWPSEKETQTRVSHWLRDRERAGHIGAGTTLHGLRVSYAAWWRRNGANTREVADLIGDESERMGAHHTRHVEAEQNIIRAFSRIKDGQDKA